MIQRFAHQHLTISTMPISDCQVRDPRVRRTRQLLQAALGSLLQSKSLDEVSVQDITEAATLNRATFYDHYTDKYALLGAMVAGQFHRLLQERQVRFDGGCDAAIGALIRAVYEYLTGDGSGVAGIVHGAFAPLVDAAIVDAVCRIIRQGMPPAQAHATGSPNLLAATLGWAIYGAVKQCLSAPRRPSASLVVKQVLQLLAPMIHNESSNC